MYEKCFVDSSVIGKLHRGGFGEEGHVVLGGTSRHRDDPWRGDKRKRG